MAGPAILARGFFILGLALFFPTRLAAQTRNSKAREAPTREAKAREAQNREAKATLTQQMELLQQTPDDNTLREKIIKLAQQIKPPLPIPEAARRHYVMANALLKDAKEPSDFAEAIKEFKGALLEAPWWGDAYGELGKLQESTGHFDGAMGSLALYVATNPGEEKVRGAQDQIYIIEAKKKKAAKDEEVRAQARAEAERVARAEESRHQQKRDVVARFKRITGGKIYDRRAANFENPNGKGTYTMAGVNEEEYKGSVWYHWGNACQTFVFEEERILCCFITDQRRTLSGEPSYVGTPNGPNFEDILWELPNIKYVDGTSSWDGTSMNKRVWAYFNENTGDITFSGDRPVDRRSYDPRIRYSYLWFTTH